MFIFVQTVHFTPQLYRVYAGPSDCEFYVNEWANDDDYDYRPPVLVRSTSALGAFRYVIRHDHKLSNIVRWIKLSTSWKEIGEFDVERLLASSAEQIDELMRIQMESDGFVIIVEDWNGKEVGGRTIYEDDDDTETSVGTSA